MNLQMVRAVIMLGLQAVVFLAGGVYAGTLYSGIVATARANALSR